VSQRAKKVQLAARFLIKLPAEETIETYRAATLVLPQELNSLFPHHAKIDCVSFACSKECYE
jgi:hypothetical protein